MSTNSTHSAPLADITTRAREAQRLWATVPVARRLDHVGRFRRQLVARCDEVCAAIAREVGKPAEEAIGAEVLPTADACRFLQSQATTLLAPRPVPGRFRPIWLFGQTDTIHRVPRGVVGIIGTWNYPLFLNAGQILQALVAGNAVVWKPSELTPAFADLLHAMLLEAGFPADLIQRLPATREMGPELANATIDHLVFTGSAPVGRKLAAQLGERLVSSTLELSGCDAMFVLADASVKLAAGAAWFGATLNRGQTCIAVRRVLVQRGLYAAFRDELQPLAEEGRPCKLALPSQADQARRLVEEALARGGRLLAQTLVREGDCRPMVVMDARPDMAICREASFAPVLAVIPFDTVEEALAIEEQCPYALGASIFTRDLAAGQRLALQLRAGAISINDVVVPTAHPATPFGGAGASGWGVTQGAEGLLEMTVPHVVSIKSGTFRPHYDSTDPEKLKKQAALLRGLLFATHGTMTGRLRGWWHVVKALWRGV